MIKGFHTTFGIGYDDYLNEGTTINLSAKLKNKYDIRTNTKRLSRTSPKA